VFIPQRTKWFPGQLEKSLEVNDVIKPWLSFVNIPKCDHSILLKKTRRLHSTLMISQHLLLAFKRYLNDSSLIVWFLNDFLSEKNI